MNYLWVLWYENLNFIVINEDYLQIVLLNIIVIIWLKEVILVKGNYF